MIEIKLSQGAKPGHGGVLPAQKNTLQIAKIRGVEPFTTILSPPRHSAFKDYKGLVEFIAKLRHLSNGKPIGFKLCIGETSEFEKLCSEMIQQNCFSDFITVDGAEGGTGAAPPEFSDGVGMPFEPALIFVNKTLVNLGSAMLTSPITSSPSSSLMALTPVAFLPIGRTVDSLKRIARPALVAKTISFVPFVNFASNNSSLSRIPMALIPFEYPM
jgi:hypothetical protein